MSSVVNDVRSLSQRLDLLIDTTGTASGSIELDNGEQAVFTITTSSNSGAKVMVVADVTLYITSVLTANVLPGGDNVDESDWQVIGPWSDWGETNNINHKTMVYVRNISAGTTTVLIRTTSRVLANTSTPDTTT